jgi:type VI secretion system protein ImpE
MTTAELIKEGKLSEARQHLVAQIKAAPSDLGRRTTLAQVLCFCGEWDKAQRQLDAIAAQDPKREPGVAVYRNLIQAERERQEVLEGSARPALLPKAPPYFDTYREFLEALSKEDMDRAEPLFETLEGTRPLVTGTVNGAPFSGICDTDSALSFFLEIMVHERYVWMAFEAIRELVLDPPVSLFDLIWAPGRITAWSGLTLNCFIPVLYANASSHGDDRIRMGRMTDWLNLGGPFVKATGQRTLQIGDKDMALLEIRELLIDSSGGPATQEEENERSPKA